MTAQSTVWTLTVDWQDGWLYSGSSEGWIEKWSLKHALSYVQALASERNNSSEGNNSNGNVKLSSSSSEGAAKELPKQQAQVSASQQVTRLNDVTVYSLAFFKPRKDCKLLFVCDDASVQVISAESLTHNAEIHSSWTLKDSLHRDMIAGRMLAANESKKPRAVASLGTTRRCPCTETLDCLEKCNRINLYIASMDGRSITRSGLRSNANASVGSPQCMNALRLVAVVRYEIIVYDFTPL